MTNIPVEYSPLTVAIAMSLYAFNVSPWERAQKLYEHFNGNCAEVDELATILDQQRGYEATTLALPTSRIYVRHALERYGVEAQQRVFQCDYEERMMKP